MTDISDREHLKARAEFAGEEAERWKRHHAATLSALPIGTTVVIDLSTGEFVTANSWQEADAAFEQRFGTLDRLSHSYTIGRPIFIGGGLWQK